MADNSVHEKDYHDGSGTSDDSGSQTHALVFERPTGLKGLYYHPLTQTAMLGLVCFMCPGMFNALTGLGGGGQVDPTTNSNSNAALYAVCGQHSSVRMPLITN